MTYRETAIEKIKFLGVSQSNAEEIVSLIAGVGEFATQVFPCFEESDDWDAEVKYVSENSEDENGCEYCAGGLADTRRMNDENYCSHCGRRLI